MQIVKIFRLSFCLKHQAYFQIHKCCMVFKSSQCNYLYGNEIFPPSFSLKGGERYTTLWTDLTN